MMNKRIVIPNACRKQVVQNLHAAHQGVSGMMARANQTIYWPGMHSTIRKSPKKLPKLHRNIPESIT